MIQFNLINIFSKNKPSLIIGNHELSGHLETLDKPLVALKKIRNNQNTSDLTYETSYFVYGVVRKKYVFNTRPKAILHI